MPLNGHAYLVSQGWRGQGTGLRHGAISRPITVSQKKTLSGIGKDRDEAFPFWDHVFSVAANTIKVKLHDDSDTEDTDTSTPTVEFQRTSTGIISNRRPTAVTPALSGAATPTEGSSSSTPRLSVMAAAKQEAARRTLYSMFFRGPVIDSEFGKDAVSGETQTTEIPQTSGISIGILEGEGEREEESPKEKAKEKTEDKKRKHEGESELNECAERKRKRGRDKSSKDKRDKVSKKVKVVDNEKEQSSAERKRRKEEKREKKLQAKKRAQKEASDLTTQGATGMGDTEDAEVDGGESGEVGERKRKRRKEGSESKHKKSKRQEST